MSAALQLWCCEDRRGAFVEVFQRSAAATGYDLRLFAPRANPPADFVALTRSYIHLSPNAPAFELAVFRRYFEVRDALAGTKERIIIADSDLLLLAPAAALTEWRDADGLVGSRGVTDGVTETDISPHFSFWTADMLAAFCAFVVQCYDHDVDRLSAIHAARTAARERLVSISDMTLLALWIAAENVPFHDSNRLRGERYLDHNIGMADCADASFERQFGRKALGFEDGAVTLRTTDGRRISPVLLHFVGRNKRIMPAVEAHSGFRVAAQSAALSGARAVRAGLRR